MKEFITALQALHRPRRPEREEEAAAHPDHLHQRPAEGTGAGLRRDPLPGHLHPRGAGPQDRPHRGPRAGLVPEPAGEVPQAGAGGGGGGGGRQERLVGQEVGRVAGRREQGGQEHRPGQHRRARAQPQPGAQLRRRRRAQPGGGPRRGRRRRAGPGGGQRGGARRLGGGGGARAGLGSRAGAHHLHPGFLRRPFRQRTLVPAETQRHQRHLGQERHVLNRGPGAPGSAPPRGAPFRDSPRRTRARRLGLRPPGLQAPTGRLGPALRAGSFLGPLLPCRGTPPPPQELVCSAVAPAKTRVCIPPPRPPASATRPAHRLPAARLSPAPPLRRLGPGENCPPVPPPSRPSFCWLLLLQCDDFFAPLPKSYQKADYFGRGVSTGTHPPG